MTRARWAGLAAVGALFAIGCQTQAPTLSDAQKASIADSVKTVVQRIIANSNKLDFPAVFQDYSADPDARFTENGALYASLDAMKKAYADLVPTMEIIDNTVDAWNVTVLAEDAAAVTLPIHLRIKAKGRPEYKGQYVWSGIVQRRNGAWKLIQSHESWQNAEQIMAAITPTVVQAGAKK
jgi:ketosteroid isomerase-like protein